jgi:hypothetical protein
VPLRTNEKCKKNTIRHKKPGSVKITRGKRKKGHGKNTRKNSQVGKIHVQYAPLNQRKREKYQFTFERGSEEMVGVN